jgi:hypothetical protein
MKYTLLLAFLQYATALLAQQPTPFVKVPDNKPGFSKIASTPMSPGNLTAAQLPMLSRVTLNLAGNSGDISFEYDPSNRLTRMETVFQTGNRTVQSLFYDSLGRVYLMVEDAVKRPDLKKKSRYALVTYSPANQISAVDWYNTSGVKSASWTYRYDGLSIVRSYQMPGRRVMMEDRYTLTSDKKNILQFRRQDLNRTTLGFYPVTDPFSYLPDILSELYYNEQTDFHCVLGGNTHLFREQTSLVEGRGSSPLRILVEDYGTDQQGRLTNCILKMDTNADGRFENPWEFRFEYRAR